MKKLSDLIVDRRNIILMIFIIFTIICAILAGKVNINYDMTKYLPKTSETRIGMNYMEDEFDEIKESSLNIMFHDLSKKDKKSILKYLNNIDGVSSVSYDDTKEYNKDNYTLYVLNVDDYSDSKTAKRIYDDVNEHFQKYDISTGGSIASENRAVLPIWIMALAVLCMYVILTFMCESYVEPFLFLISILVAVLLNKGTNIIFPKVSNITNSIVAILQMALSMDYSIMLMERYRQEKQKYDDKAEAMKKALYNAFTAISSSSLTTIVGLLALAFMSFTIGKDLGFVLAKGVSFSLISIFFVLPALILSFDKLITKTKKKTPHFKLDLLGKYSFKFRYIAVIVFLLIFAVSYFTKGSLNILYTESQQDKISEVFKENNQMAIIYDKKDEKIIASYLKKLEKDKKVDQVLGYSNTINEKLHYNELNEMLNDLGASVSVDDYLIKLLYYNYYNVNGNDTMTFKEFTDFIKKEVYNNKNLEDKINDNMKNNINKLENFITSESINKKRSASEISNILDIDQSKVESLFVYYLSKNNNTKITLNDFVYFMNKDVFTNDSYSKSISREQRESLNTLAKFTNRFTITTKMNSSDMANLLGMDQSKINDLYIYYTSLNNNSIELSLQEFSSFILNDVLNNPQYSSLFDNTTINKIKMLSTFSNKDIINKEMTSNELSNLFGISEDIVKQGLLLKYSKQENNSRYTIAELVQAIAYLKNNTNYLDNIDLSMLENIDQTLLTNNTKFSATELSGFLNVSTEMTYQLYALIDLTKSNTENWKMSPYSFVNLLLENKDKLDSNTIEQLSLVSNIMNSAVNNQKYSYTTLATFIGTNQDTVRNIYSLYISSKTVTKLTPIELIDFILTHKNDALLVNSLNKETINLLQLVQTIMFDTVNNKKLDSTELSNLLGISKNNLDLLYGLYTSIYISSNYQLSLKEFVSFILNDVMVNPQFSSNFDDNSRFRLNIVNGIMVNTLKNTKYNKDELFTIINMLSSDIDPNLIDLVYMYYGSTNSYNKNWMLTVEEFVNYLNNTILTDKRFDDFIDSSMRKNITEAKKMISDAKKLLIGKKHGRVIINTKYDSEAKQTFDFIKKIKKNLKGKDNNIYVIGDSPMAYEMNQTFSKELDFITIITMVLIFLVVACTFKSVIIPLILVLVIQCAVYLTMGILSLSGNGVYFIALLIVQSILMGATIDYAILYTTYYIENRRKNDIEYSIINSYNKSINTILTSSSILILATFIIGMFTSGIISQICKTLSKGTLCALLLILILLPAMLGAFDRVITKRLKK